jgi:P27 family predicted phage terminase small subunit
MRGRKPRPTYLKVISGVRKGRINQHEAKAPPGMPSPPEFLSPEALEEWHRIGPALYAAGLLTPLDRGVFAVYCTAVGRWQQAEKALAEAGGLVVPSTSNNHASLANPLLHIANRAAADAVKFGSEFGLTPSSRSRVVAQPPPAEADPSDKYFD